MMYKRLSVLWVIFSLSLFWACSSSSDNDEDKKSNFELIQPAIDEVISNWSNPVITAENLNNNLSGYYVLSVRSSSDYAKGHIPGAANIFWREIAKTENLNTLPKDEAIATYCYTGHTGQIAATVLKILGYDATNMKYGIMAWTKDAEVRVQSAFNEDTDAHDYAVTTEVPQTSTYELPSPAFVESQDVQEVLRAAADNYCSNHAPVITAQALFEELNDGDTSDDPQIVSVRKAEDYAKGHIPGAINIFWKEIAKVENLQKIDPNRQVVVYCYTGHTGQIAATVLNMLGYDALNLKYGIMAWTRDATVRVQNAFNEDVDAHDYPIEK